MLREMSFFQIQYMENHAEIAADDVSKLWKVFEGPKRYNVQYIISYITWGSIWAPYWNYFMEHFKVFHLHRSTDTYETLSKFDCRYWVVQSVTGQKKSKLIQ